MVIDYDAIRRNAEKKIGKITAAGKGLPAAGEVGKPTDKAVKVRETKQPVKSGAIDYDAVWKRAGEKFGTVRRAAAPEVETTRKTGSGTAAASGKSELAPLPEGWVPSWRQSDEWKKDVDKPITLPEKVMDVIMPRSVMPELRKQYDEGLEERIREEERKAQKRQTMREAGYRDPTLWDATIGSIKRGYLEAEKGKENFNVMLGGDDARKKELEETLAGEEYRFVPSGPLQKAVSGGMEMIGQQGSQLFDPLTVGAIGSFAGTAALAGQAGPQALVPEEVVTVPGAALMGWKAGSAMTNMKIEAGNAYEEMLEAGVDRDAAKLIAAAVGGVNGALEGAQLSSLAKGFDVVKSTGNKGLTDLFLQELKRRFPDVADNVFQELLQEGTTIAGTQLGSKLSNGQWAYTADEVRDRLGETAVSSALTFGAMNMPGAVGNIAWNAKNGMGNIPASGENLDTPAGGRYDGSKETEQGGLKDGRGEEAGRLDAGVEEDGGRDDRTVLWRETKAVDGGGRSKREGTGAFVGRAEAEGKTVFQAGEWRYAYRLTAEESYAPATREAIEAAKEWGLTPIVVDCFERNNGKKTFFETEAATGPQGQVILVNGRGKEEIAHEGLHSGLIRKIPESQHFMERVMELEISADKMNYVLKRISSAYYDQGGYSFKFDHLKEEVAAYLSGMIETGRVEKIFGLTEEANPEIFTSWRDFRVAMGANPMPQVGLEGDGPVSYSLDAFSKQPKPLVDDLTADALLRERTSVNFLTRKGGLELKPGMTQAEKRQAVKKAVERIARKKPDGEETGFETKEKDDIIQTVEEQDAVTQERTLTPLTQEEEAALLAYKSSESYKINAKLRDGLSLTTEEQEMVAALDKTLEKLPKVKGTVYRTLCFDDLSDAEGELAAFLDKHQIDKAVVYPAYTSTSTILDGYPLADGIKYGVILEIDGESARRLKGFGNNFEHEALFPRKTVFFITDVQLGADGIYHIKMEEVAENAGESEG